ncbi:MAG: phosphatidylserine decarboxylase [Halobacteriovoraceae bacterium]|nr:phosphatidylserine decarboxylase [Halobacteriovoraceae bacterium]
MDIKFYNRYTKKEELEKVYGGSYVNWLYRSGLGKFFSGLLCFSWPSKIYGLLQNTSLSGKKKVRLFIKKFSIKIDEFLPENESMENPYSSFNNFFIRRFRPDARPFKSAADSLPAFCEARYFGWQALEESQTIPVKKKYLTAKALTKDAWKEGDFKNGPVLLARLCPVDYHRFHFPDNGRIIRHFRIPGKLHSVNPLALAAKPDIFRTNERRVSVLQSENFGKLLYVEVGAVCVGKIVQTYKKESFMRGDEKGYFLFGGSTVILFGEKGYWAPDEDIVNNTKRGLETFIKLGDQVGRLL